MMLILFPDRSCLKRVLYQEPCNEPTLTIFPSTYKEKENEQIRRCDSTLDVSTSRIYSIISMVPHYRNALTSNRQ